jgi:hypothetical protein
MSHSLFRTETGDFSAASFFNPSLVGKREWTSFCHTLTKSKLIEVLGIVMQNQKPELISNDQQTETDPIPERKDTSTATEPIPEPTKGTVNEPANLKTNVITRAEQVLISREAIREEVQRPLRERSVILKNIPTNYIDYLLEKISTNCSIDRASLTYSKLSNRGGSCLLRLQTSSNEHANQVFNSIPTIRVTNIDKLGAISARRDYSKSELTVYRHLWMVAIERNNMANKYLWTVRDLKLVQLKASANWAAKTTTNPTRPNSSEFNSKIRALFSPTNL